MLCAAVRHFDNSVAHVNQPVCHKPGHPVVQHQGCSSSGRRLHFVVQPECRLAFLSLSKYFSLSAFLRRGVVNARDSMTRGLIRKM